MSDMRPMELKDTVEMMGSEDYKEIFKAEYCQVKIRYGKLKYMLERWDNELLDFVPTCPRSTYDMQIRAMSDYIAVLEARAVMEGIILPNRSQVQALNLGVSQRNQNDYLIDRLQPCAKPAYFVPNPNCCYTPQQYAQFVGATCNSCC